MSENMDASAILNNTEFSKAIRTSSLSWGAIKFEEVSTQFQFVASRPMTPPYASESIGVLSYTYLVERIDSILAMFDQAESIFAFLLVAGTAELIATTLRAVIDFTWGDAGNRTTGLVDARACGNAAIEATSSYAFDQVASDDSSVHIVDDMWWVRALPFSDAYGLSWRVVVVQEIDCPDGWALDRTSGWGVCSQCPVGTFGEPGALDCTECAPGARAPLTGMTQCSPCGAGEFQPQRGQATCSTCDAFRGLWSEPGAALCDQCIAGLFWNGVNEASGATESVSPSPTAVVAPAASEASSPCAACTQGMDCSAGTTLLSLPLKRGYWRAHAASRSVYPCPLGEFGCKGGSDVGQDACSDGYFGAACGSCEFPEFYLNRVSGKCEACTGGSKAAVVTAGAVFATLALAAFAYSHWWVGAHTVQVRASKAYLAVSTPRLKILVATFQIIASAEASLQFTFPRPFNLLMNVLLLFRVDLDFLPVSCVAEYRFYEKLLLSTLVPVAVVALVGLLTPLRMRLAHTEQARVNVRAIHTKVALLVTFVVYPTMSANVFEMLRECDVFESEPVALRFMSIDASKSCDTDAHKMVRLQALCLLSMIISVACVLYLITLAYRTPPPPPRS